MNREGLINFVHGQASWNSLSVDGVVVDRDTYTIDIDYDPDPDPFYEVTPTDVARGLLRLREDESLRLWASILLAGPSCLDLSADFESSEGERMLGALWDAAFGEALSPDVLDLAADLAKNDPRH